MTNERLEEGGRYKKLFEILGAMHYNTERLEPMECVLRKYLATKDEGLDLKSECSVWFSNLMIERTKSWREVPHAEAIPRSFWFGQKTLLLTNVPPSYVPEYLGAKFGPFSRNFEKEYEFRPEILTLFSGEVATILSIKKAQLAFHDEVYRFATKKEYVNLGFIASPPTGYAEAWRSVVTLNTAELGRFSTGTLTQAEVSRALRVLSLDFDAKLDGSEIDFAFTPFLRLDDETFVLMVEPYLTKSLPVIYERLFGTVRAYREKKGKSFERLVQETLKSLLFKGLSYNVRYGEGFEVDAICEFQRSIWFVEVTSHPPSLEALKGEPSKIEEDLDKALDKCLAQGKRCMSHLKSKELRHWGDSPKTKGIMIVVDGVYPQLNMNTSIKFFDEQTPVYVINWFDLRELLAQPEYGRFEEFILWRTRQPMPLNCIDEKDHWGFYFDRYDTDPRIRETYETMQKKDIKLSYVSPRFTDKRYLSRVARFDSEERGRGERSRKESKSE